MVRELFPDLAEADVQTLSSYALAGADGLFVHREIKSESVDLVPMFELHGPALPSEEPQAQAARRIRFYRGNTLMVGAKAGST